jgi:hypothetical protein
VVPGSSEYLLDLMLGTTTSTAPGNYWPTVQSTRLGRRSIYTMEA